MFCTKDIFLLERPLLETSNSVLSFQVVTDLRGYFCNDTVYH